MITHQKLFKNHINFIDKLISFEKNNFEEFIKMGWSIKQVLNQLNKSTNLSFGGFYKDSLISFILGDLFNIEKISEYEILLLYVRNDFRNKGLATKLLKIIKEKNICLKKINLEVSENNLQGISFYKKMNFKKIYTRKKYFSFQGLKSDAIIMSKYY